MIAAKTAPLVIFLLVGGVFADRLPRRGVMLTADVTRMVIQAATAALLLGNMLFNTLWETTLQQHVPPASLSRVSAYDWFGSLLGQPLGLQRLGEP